MSAVAAPAQALTLDDILTDVSCKLERLRALYSSTTIDLQDLLHAEPPIEGTRGRMLYDLWMIYTLAGEKLDEIDGLIAQADVAFSRAGRAS